MTGARREDAAHLTSVFSRRWWLLLVLLPAVALATAWYWPRPEAPALTADWVAAVSVVAGDQFTEPYGIAVAPDGTFYVADGAGGHRILAISPTGRVTTVAGSTEGFADGLGQSAQFSTPSGIAVDATGTLYVADTGNNAIRRIAPGGLVSTIATGLNAPIGIALDPRGQLVVADTYNDRIAVVDPGGPVRVLPIAVPLDTPSSIAIDAGGTLYIADTGNNLVRVVPPAGDVITLDGLGVGGLRRPTGVAVDAAGALYVTDESARLFEWTPGAGFGDLRVIAGSGAGFENGVGAAARFRQPAGLASIEPGRLVVADSGNGLVRSVTAVALAEAAPPPSPRIRPRLDLGSFIGRPLLWPLDPLHGPFEIAGTLGEARGADAGRFHAGIDVRADQGAPVLAIRDGIITAPLATGEFGTLNEWLRLGPLAYVHLRVGRAGNKVMDDTRFVATYDERGQLSRMRVKRGAQFYTGDTLGSVNAFNHVHLNVGWGGEELNPLLFGPVQFVDTRPPTIARGGVRLFDLAGTPLLTRVKGRLVVTGAVQVVVDAWDQADGNRANRRLGVYSLGYQILHADHTPVAGFEQPVETIRFDRLVSDPDASRLVYAPGSGIPFYGGRRTRFLYVVTNTFRDGVAAPGVWDTATLAPGDYILRIRVADIHGNEATEHRDVAVTVTGRPHPADG